MTSDYDLKSHELLLLENAARTADLVVGLQALLDKDGLVSGGKTHPALPEIRQQRITLARLLVALRDPAGEESDRPAGPQRRGRRSGRHRQSSLGVYQLGGPDAS